ncbi:hypothetical protein D3C76_1273890 [compost metagenome]
MVIADQRPVIKAKTRIRQLQVVPGPAWQVLQMPAEVIAQVADQTAGERQLMRRRQGRFAQPRQVVAQALQEITATFVRRYRQLLQRPGAEQVIASAIGAWPAAVEQHGTGGVTDGREVFGGVGAIV